MAISSDDLEWFDLSPAARDLARQVNGRDTVEALAGLLRLPVARLLGELEVLAREGCDHLALSNRYSSVKAPCSPADWPSTTA